MLKLALRKSYRLLMTSLLLLAICAAARPSFAQTANGQRHTEVTGAVSVTNKGISLIPSFTLGRPAAIFDVGIRNGNFSFEPQFKTGLDGKPWAFLFWFRHRSIDGERFRLAIGGHPAFSFRTLSVTANGADRDVIIVRRYLAGELYPTYVVTKHLTVGAYYLASRAFEKDVARNTHFLAARAFVTTTSASDRYVLVLAPQLYYLKTDAEDGYYANAGVTLSKRNFPVSISATVNKPIRTRIAAGRDFLWNVSANYAFK